MQQGEGNMNLGEYLVWLGQSSENLKKHLRNPGRTMRDQGVDAEDRALLLEGDPEAIHDRVQALGLSGVAIIVCGNWPIIVSG
jgi:hypothetical protein